MRGRSSSFNLSVLKQALDFTAASAMIASRVIAEAVGIASGAGHRNRAFPAIKLARKAAPP